MSADLVTLVATNVAPPSPLTIEEVLLAWESASEDRASMVARPTFLSRRSFSFALDAGIVDQLGPLIVHPEGLRLARLLGRV